MQIDRRLFLRLTTGSALAGSLGVSALLEACTPASPTSKPAAPAAPGAAPASGPLPTYIASSGGPKADFHSPDPRITDGFLRFPKDPVKSWSGGPPSNGGTLNVFMAGYYPPPTPRDQNATWKEIEKALGSTVNMTITPNADYSARVQVVMAGNDLPDTIHVVGTVASLISSQFVQAQCADLTPYLAGDAAKDYPNLAAIPGYAYKGAGGIFDNRLYGIPIHRYLPAFWFFKNSDIYDKDIGADVVPKDTEDFKKILQQLNRPQENRWAIGNFGPNSATMYGIVSFLEMFGAPNLWGLDASGKLVRDRETDAYKAAVSYMKDLMTSGLYPPDLQTATQSRDALLAGKFVVSNEAFGNGWNDMWRRGLQLNPPRHFTIIKPFASSANGKPQHFITGGTVAYNLVKKSSPDRTREILRIMNYLAAPFGTQEDLLLTYGVRDQDYTVDADGNPAPTQAGIQASQYVPWQYIAHRPYVWYQADLPGYAQAAFDVEQTLVGVGVADPTRGFHSPTQSRKGVAADQAFYDGVADILFNRRPFSDFDQLVTDWRTNAGDAIRKEFLDEISASN
jgi:putative aldouronate transport system substrate-binding protein